MNKAGRQQAISIEKQAICPSLAFIVRQGMQKPRRQSRQTNVGTFRMDVDRRELWLNDFVGS